MNDDFSSRRLFLAAATAAGIGVSRAETPLDAPPLSRTRPAKLSLKGRKPLACITTVYRPLSHSYHIAGRFIHGFAMGERMYVPKQSIGSIYAHQEPDNDLSRDVCKEFGIKHARSIEDALISGGKLAVEGVLLIAEHGNYPLNDKGQILYPRYEWMEEIARVFRKVGKSCPVFCDKHLSYTFDKAQKMLARGKELTFPVMAGSSLPVVWRRPELELRLDAPIEDALVACYGPLEIYGFHALETLQTMIERRKGGETGVKSVQCLIGKEVWRAGDAGRWSWELLESALAKSETVNPGDIRQNVGSMKVLGHPVVPPTAFLIDYRDGSRGTVLLLNGHIRDFVFSAKLRGEKKHPACRFVLPEPPGARFFDAQVLALEKFFDNGKAPYPVERTLLTTGVLDSVIESHFRKGVKIDTPELEVRYTAPADSGFVRGSIAEA
ncbi:MAG: hypothetical protein EBV06_07190 [Planctomycetia bacterium]|nr:hypothetical protein [Planctomycetia bacterium]